MARCGGCGKQLGDESSSCPWCGGTLIVSRAERGLQPLFEPGRELSGRFKVEELLGTGATGVVYGVWDSLQQGHVALKVLWERADDASPALERLRREIRTSKKAPHEHLVAIHDILIVEGHPALVMEWVRGETLKDRLRREGALPWREAVALGETLLQALAHLHGLGIVHRDLKSGNILVGEGGAVKLADFGLAKGEDLGMTLTVTGASLGTPGYMAPEVIRGKEATPVSDLYSMGAVFYEMLTGRTPFVGVSSLEVASRQLSEPAPLEPLRDRKLPGWLVGLVTRLLEREAGDRFQSAKATLAALRKRSPGFALARRWRVRAAFLAGLGLLAASLIGLRQWTDRQSPLDVAFHGRTLEARDSSGTVLWRREMPRDVQSAVYGHFGPQGSAAVACAVAWDPSAVNGAPSDEQANNLYLLDRRGTILNRYGLSLAQNPFEARYGITLTAHRFSRAGHELLVLDMRHATWYPASLQVLDYDGVSGDETGAVVHVDCSIYNSGHLPYHGYRDLDGDGVDEIVFAGVNNRLYWSDVVGAAKLDPTRSIWPNQIESPDVESGHAPLFYRCFSFRPYNEMVMDAPPLPQPLRLAFSAGPSYLLEASGILRGPATALPPPEWKLSKLNEGLANLCRLRDLGSWTDLLRDARAWSDRAEGAYAWLGRLFQVHALMGLGRYDDARTLIKEAGPAPGDAFVPPYAGQFLVDSLFLGGKYRDCLQTASRLPQPLRTSRPELAISAAWAAIYSGDASSLRQWLAPGTFQRYQWEPDLFDGISSFLSGNHRAATDVFQKLDRSLGDRFSEPGRWLVASLICQGRIREARRAMARLAAGFPTERLDQGELELWLRWNEGSRDAALAAQFDSVLAKARTDAATNVEARALLPLTLARAAAIHGAGGQPSEASRLQNEALRLAPESWSPLLRDIAASR